MEGSHAHGHLFGAPSLLRLAFMTVCGTAISVATAFVAPWQLALLTGWITAAVTLLVVVWRVIATADGERTRRFATVEDDSRAVASLVVVASCTASLAGAGFALHKASRVAGIEAALLTVGSVAVVVVSWLVVNTEFTLRYAHRSSAPRWVASTSRVPTCPTTATSLITLHDRDDLSSLRHCATGTELSMASRPMPRRPTSLASSSSPP